MNGYLIEILSTQTWNCICFIYYKKEQKMQKIQEGMLKIDSLLDAIYLRFDKLLEIVALKLL